MMKIKIHQINKDKDTNRVIFMNHKLATKYQGSDKIDRSIYDEVFSGTVDCRNLEDVFMVFNCCQPKGYKGRCLSVSDVVEIIKSEVEKPGFYFCDSFGFERIEF